MFENIKKAAGALGNWATKIESWIALGGIVGSSGLFSWLATTIKPISDLGWGAVVFAGLGAACTLALVASALLIAWRYFHPLSSQLSGKVRSPLVKDSKRISSVLLVPSGSTLALVVTPNQVNTRLGIFVDLSHWRTSVSSAGWTRPERLFLGEVQVRPNLRFSLTVMEQTPKEGMPVPLQGWLWKHLKADGSPSGTLPTIIHGKQRAIFVFTGSDGQQEEYFPMLLVKENFNPDVPPTVVTPDDLSITSRIS